MNADLASPLLKLFSRNAETLGYETRQQNNPRRINNNTNTAAKSIASIGPRIWSNLSVRITAMRRKEAFAESFKNYKLELY